MNKLGYLLFFLFILYFIFLIRQDIIDNIELRQDVERTAAALRLEEARGSELKQKLEQLNKIGYIEEQARVRLGYIKKGETAYKVMEGKVVHGN